MPVGSETSKFLTESSVTIPCSANEWAAEVHPVELKKMIEGSRLVQEHVYKCDETGLHYNMLPDKTLAQKTDDKKT